MRIVSIHPARLRVRARRWRVSLCVGIADEVDAASLAGGTSGTKAGEGVGSGSGLNVAANPLPRPRLP